MLQGRSNRQEVEPRYQRGSWSPKWDERKNCQRNRHHVSRSQTVHPKVFREGLRPAILGQQRQEPYGVLIRGIEQKSIDHAHSTEEHRYRLPEHHCQEMPVNQNEQKCSLRAETSSWVYPRGHQSRETKGQQCVFRRRLKYDVSHLNA